MLVSSNQEKLALLCYLIIISTKVKIRINFNQKPKNLKGNPIYLKIQKLQEPTYLLKTKKLLLLRKALVWVINQIILADQPFLQI